MSQELDPGRAYQAQLLSLVGDDDPAEIQQRTAASLRELVAEVGDLARVKPAPGEFSLVELIGHLVDAQLVTFTRYRWILAQDEPPLPGYEQDDWVRVSGYADADPAELIDLFETVQRANIELWRRTPAASRPRVGLHAERGPESYELTFKITAGHDLLHLEQARQIVGAVTGSS
jgi:hypothetical protein